MNSSASGLHVHPLAQLPEDLPGRANSRRLRRDDGTHRDSDTAPAYSDQSGLIRSPQGLEFTQAKLATRNQGLLHLTRRFDGEKWRIPESHLVGDAGEAFDVAIYGGREHDLNPSSVQIFRRL